MSSLALPQLSTAAFTTVTPRKSDDPGQVRDAGRQFEALMIGQILHSAHESGTGWLGAPEDSASDCATDFAEQQFAAVMARAGGFGISQMIERNLERPVPLPSQSPHSGNSPKFP